MYYYMAQVCVFPEGDSAKLWVSPVFTKKSFDLARLEAQFPNTGGIGVYDPKAWGDAWGATALGGVFAREIAYFKNVDAFKVWLLAPEGTT